MIRRLYLDPRERAFGLKPRRVRRIREALQMDSRTLKRWCQWWLDSFVRSSLWKVARAPVHACVVRADAALVVVVEF
jgi:hypothetical protein